MDFELVKIIVNSSLFILIWMIQLVVYPGFLYYSETDLKRWHPIYTKRISLLVMPLMLSQLVIYSYLSVFNPVASDILILILIVINWLVTFFMAVPLHNAIGTAENTTEERKKLISINWIRSISWTIIFLTSLYYYGK